MAPAEILPRLGEYYRSDAVLDCTGSSAELRRSVPGEVLSPGETQVSWCACGLQGQVQASIILPVGAQADLPGVVSLADSTCYTWSYFLGPQAVRGEYKFAVEYQNSLNKETLEDAFSLALPSAPQAVWLENQNLIWAGGFLPNENVRLLVFSAPQEETLRSESAYSLFYQFENTIQASASGEVWMDPGSPAVSSTYRVVVFVGQTRYALAGRGLPSSVAGVLALHLFNDCSGVSTSLRVGQVVRTSSSQAPIYLSSLLFDDEVLDELPQGEPVTLLDGPLCDQGGWRWKVDLREGTLQGWMLDTDLAP